ncbi:type IV pilus assembly PilZ [Solidesulfovibrio carbinoliphilus subsp. oakridgensis]|uniref:Type IV pilus assembly PilZ n=2 Tax=Desulfovibrionaceae TaxID=194924 RepID=G7QDY6_9BACT|nr:PilZ domain-containing protein [Solidesulfovibrio carbinoliphilus]EHJ46642.1 type IV pilus assembly PilZ [Solidesulfovibrio carbinoliphilus subsp. oakridgensis]
MEEKRTFMRIPTRLTGHLRLLPGPDDMPVFRETPLLGSGNCPLDPREAGMSESLYTILCSINSKLDMLLSMQSRDQLETDFPVPMTIIEISGAGVRFSTPEPMALDQYVEAVVVLSRFPLRMAGAVGRIVRQDTVDEQPVYALDFTRIRERDLESIVQFVFQSQRDDLRGKKWD